MPDEQFPIRDVSEWEIVGIETSGADEKYWLRSPGTGERWLFKSVTIKGDHVHGEDWAETAVAHLGGYLHVPRARVEMAERLGSSGCISANLCPDASELQPGQVLLEECEAPGYEHRIGKLHPGHSLENIQEALRDAQPPPECKVPFEATAFDVLVGYVVLDAWIANRDRHDNNWAVLRPITSPGAPRRLCSSYDHANSLGFNLTDETRALWVPKTCVTWADALLSAVPRPVPTSRSWPVRTCDDLRLVGLKLIFLTVSSAMSLLRLSRREEWWKDAEILMLRHQLAVALRERPRAAARLTWPDRAWLALLAGTLPIDRLAGMRLIVTPATILRWHRDLCRPQVRRCQPTPPRTDHLPVPRSRR